MRTACGAAPVVPFVHCTAGVPPTPSMTPRATGRARAPWFAGFSCCGRGPGTCGCQLLFACCYACLMPGRCWPHNKKAPTTKMMSLGARSRTDYLFPTRAAPQLCATLAPPRSPRQPGGLHAALGVFGGAAWLAGSLPLLPPRPRESPSASSSVRVVVSSGRAFCTCSPVPGGGSCGRPSNACV